MRQIGVYIAQFWWHVSMTFKDDWSEENTCKKTKISGNALFGTWKHSMVIVVGQLDGIVDWNSWWWDGTHLFITVVNRGHTRQIPGLVYQLHLTKHADTGKSRHGRDHHSRDTFNLSSRSNKFPDSLEQQLRSSPLWRGQTLPIQRSS